MASNANANPAVAATATATKPKLHGRAFYESIGSPKFVVAPMVDQSEFAWRMLTRSFMTPAENAKLLAYTPMFHARLFEETPKYRESHFQSTFCANDPAHLLAAARHAAPYCDAIDLNLGCPQGIARKGHYGAFLQEDQDLIFCLINNLHNNLPIPVTAKIRVLETKEQTLAYAQNVLNAGASIITVHGRRREQKGHLTGVADWSFIRYLRENLPRDTVIFANGNVLQPGDVDKCLEATGADAVMSAEGNLSDPAIFGAAPPVGQEGREYWRGKDGRGGYRVDAVFRRYMNIIHQHVLQQEPPSRRPLFVIGDDESGVKNEKAADEGEDAEEEGPARKKRKKEGGGGGKPKACTDSNLLAMRPHLFHLLRHFVSKHTDIRDALARARPGDMAAFEDVLDKVEHRVAEDLVEYEKADGQSIEADLAAVKAPPSAANGDNKGKEKKAEAEAEAEVEEEDPDYDPESSVATVKQCKRPWWVVQPIVRPLPKEALAKGALSLSKKDKKKMMEEEQKQQQQQQQKAQNAAAVAAPLDSSSKVPEEELPKPDRKEAIKEPPMDDKASGLTSDELVCG
ncbi:hypothetical protein PG994_010178 [Apiospora phragmitis]|uniref:tRNA-dihydrouridine(16/17) synthase [NAD(P)(+)] n=1 Tax=Apiospora phragmitis TaxID=2905665 RepID=A0ABR1TP68_9PEZI